MVCYASPLFLSLHRFSSDVNRPPQVKMELPLDDNPRGKAALVIIWVLTIVSTSLVALRIYVKLRTTRRLWWDDWLQLMALVGRLTAARVLY